jgi:secreted trypsin-like serine protease
MRFTIIILAVFISHVICITARLRPHWTAVSRASDSSASLQDYLLQANQTGQGIEGPVGGARVAYGSKAKLGQFPFSAFILAKVDKATFACTGTLIGPRVVLTAAHCVIDYEGKLINPKNLSIKIGVLKTTEPTTGRRVQRIVAPPYRVNKNFEYGDIALLQLTKPVPALVQPAALAPPRTRPAGGSILVFYGW